MVSVKLPRIALLVVTSFTFLNAAAQAYPSRPLRLVVPLAAGGGADTSSRMLARKLEERIGQPVVVENRPGGNSVIGAMSVARAPADGYTLLSGSDLFTPTFFSTLPFDFAKEMQPVSLIYQGSFVLIVNADFPARNLAEFVAYAKANPGKLNSGTATPVTMMAAEVFKAKAGVDIVKIVYKGENAVVPALMTSEVHLALSTTSAYKALLDAGKLRAIASTGRARHPLLPAVPTLAESGYPDYVATYTSGIWAPAGTPREIIDRLNREFVAIAKLPDVQTYYRTITGAEPVGSSPDAYAEATRADKAFWAEAARVAKFVPD
jgi:tripartite-type tricarboxylate transporter receptor subunit TctC